MPLPDVLPLQPLSPGLMDDDEVLRRLGIQAPRPPMPGNPPAAAQGEVFAPPASPSPSMPAVSPMLGKGTLSAPTPEERRYQQAAQQPEPQLHGFKKGLDIAGQIAFPGIEQYIPGTPGNYQRNLSNLAGEAGLGEKVASAQLGRQADEVGLGKSQADILKMKNTPAYYTADKGGVTGAVSETGERLPGAVPAGYVSKTVQKIDPAKLSNAGLIQDPETGEIRPMTAEEAAANPVLSSKMGLDQATQGYRKAQADLAEARAELARAGNDPNSPAYKLAERKIAVATQNSELNAARAKAYLMRAYGEFYGTSPEGAPLPGIGADLQGNPIGTSIYRETGPTGQQRNRGQFARDAIQYLHTNVYPNLDRIAKSGDTGPVKGALDSMLAQYGLLNDPGFLAYMTNSELMKGAVASIHFGGRGIAEQFQGAIDYLLNPKQPEGVLKSNLQQFENLLTIYARSGGRSLTQTPLKGEKFPPNNAGSGKNQPAGNVARGTGQGGKAVGETSRPDGVYEMEGKRYRVTGGKVYAE